MPLEDEPASLARNETLKDQTQTLNNSLQTDESSDEYSDDQIVARLSNIDPRKITPGTISATERSTDEFRSKTPILLSAVKKDLFGGDNVVSCVTPARIKYDTDDKHLQSGNRKRPRITESPAKRQLLFGRSQSQIAINSNVRAVYKIINQRTGAIGGNGSFGPIYGELTAGSMQKMVNLMKEHTNFDSTSLFMDIGSGIGKPNLHVSQDPGVEVSLGIECEESRWILSMNCLRGVVDIFVDQHKQIVQGDCSNDNSRLTTCNCLFIREDVLNVHTFDPFTHVYMFSIGYVICVIMRNYSASKSYHSFQFSAFSLDPPLRGLEFM
jgi:Histone methylation protein DOT1